MNKELEKLWDSKCPNDYKKRHRFERLGVVLDPTKLRIRYYLIWQCSQCKKCLCEDLVFLDD